MSADQRREDPERDTGAGASLDGVADAARSSAGSGCAVRGVLPVVTGAGGSGDRRRRGRDRSATTRGRAIVGEGGRGRAAGGGAAVAGVAGGAAACEHSPRARASIAVSIAAGYSAAYCSTSGGTLSSASWSSCAVCSHGSMRPSARSPEDLLRRRLRLRRSRGAAQAQEHSRQSQRASEHEA